MAGGGGTANGGINTSTTQTFTITVNGVNDQPNFPAINVGTTPEAVEVMALAPGVDPNGLQITVDRGLLVIAGERKAVNPSGSPEANDRQGTRQDVNVYAKERFTGTFRRVLSLPEDADPSKVEANYRDGVLRISVGRRESSRPRRIEVN